MADTEVSTAAPQTPPLPSELPVVPLRETVVLPMTVAPLGVGRPVSVEAINRALAGDRMVLLLLQRGDGGRAVGRRPAPRRNGRDHPADGEGADRACACWSRASRGRARSFCRTITATSARCSSRCRNPRNGRSTSTRACGGSRNWSTRRSRSRPDSRPTSRRSS